jgi:thiol-disulfide isomerase/thioredoxin
LFLLQVSSAEENLFLINGKISPDFNGNKVKLMTYDSGRFKMLDSTIVNNGQFIFKGIEFNKDISKIMIDGFYDRKLPVFLEKGVIEINVGKEYWQYSVGGTTLNNLYQFYSDSCMYFTRKINDMLAKGDGGRLIGNSGFEVYPGGNVAKEYFKYGAFTVDFKKKNIANPVGKAVFRDELNEFRMNESIWSHGTDSAFSIIYDLADEKLKSDPLVIEYIEKKKQRKIKQDFIASITGKPFANLSLTTIDGKVQEFSSLVGKSDFILIDFWASWCNPCINSIPGLKDIYSKYKSKGLEVVGITLDADSKEWENGLKKIDTPWLNFKITGLSDQNEYVKIKKKLYDVCGLSGIPYMILLDKNGKILIVGTHLSEGALLRFLDKK